MGRVLELSQGQTAVQDSVTSSLEKTRTDKKILIVSGERRGESAGRSKYNEMEIHRINAEKRFHRTVHQWRTVIDYSEKDVWEVLKRYKLNPHPRYRIGWNRCSCAMCIFSTPSLFAGIKEIYPEEYKALRQDEKILGFTLDNKKCLDDFVGNAESCVYWEIKRQFVLYEQVNFQLRYICERLEISGRGVSWNRMRAMLDYFHVIMICNLYAKKVPFNRE